MIGRNSHRRLELQAAIGETNCGYLQSMIDGLDGGLLTESNAECVHKQW